MSSESAPTPAADGTVEALREDVGRILQSGIWAMREQLDRIGVELAWDQLNVAATAIWPDFRRAALTEAVEKIRAADDTITRYAKPGYEVELVAALIEALMISTAPAVSGEAT